jgi:hypothetical protein
MTTLDAIREYSSVIKILEDSSGYIDCAQVLIDAYINFTHTAVTKFSCSNDSNKRVHLENDLSKNYAELYKIIKKLNSCSVSLLLTFGKFTMTLNTYKLAQADVNAFTEIARGCVEEVNTIIENDLHELERNDDLCLLLNKLQLLVSIYEKIIGTGQTLQKIGTIILEPLPDEVENSNNFTELTIQSTTPSLDLPNIANSLENMDKFLHDMHRLLINDPSKKSYYLRKVESGSILLDVSVLAPTIKSIINFVDICFVKFMTCRKTIQSDKAEALKLGVAEIEAARTLIEFNKNLSQGEVAELMQQASLSLFKYFKINPEFEINGREYNSQQEQKLLTEISSNISENKQTENKN